MAERCGFATGVSLEGLLVAIEFAEACLGGALGGRSSAWLRSQRNRS
jgi:hydroxymethylglutaryl-CoA lyase